jgi:bacterioferritin-associated ferredoxin
MKKQFFNQHFKNLKGFGNPIDSQAEFDLLYGEDQWKVWLVIKQNKLNAFHFTGPQDSFWTPFFSLFAERAQNLAMEQAMTMGWTDIKEWIESELEDTQETPDEEAMRFLTLEGSGYLPLLCLPAFMLTQALVQFLGGDLTLEKVKGLKADEIVCHCFGTTKTEIKNLIRQHPEADLAMINGKLLAGSACGDCQDDCLEFLNAKKSYAESVEGSFLKSTLLDNYQGKNQYDFLKMVGGLMAEFENGQGLKERLGIVNLRDRFLTLNQPLDHDVRKNLEHFLFDRTGFKLFVRF